jgi:hypothetical protein
LRRGTGAAPGLFEKPATTAGLAELRRAQQFAAIVDAGFAGEDLVEEGNCVIIVFPGQRVVAFGEEGADVTRDFIHTFFCHSEGSYAEKRKKLKGN